VIARADYTAPEVDRSALVLIDVQNDFVSGAAVVDGTAERIEVMARLAALFRAAGRPIVHIVRLCVPGEATSTCLGVRPLKVAARWLLRIAAVQKFPKCFSHA
jgi:nicotinamidase-related amidase